MNISREDIIGAFEKVKSTRTKLTEKVCLFLLSSSVDVANAFSKNLGDILKHSNHHIVSGYQ